MSDPFKPTRDPARSIYEAFQAAAAHRAGRSPDEWMAVERDAVFKEAVHQATKLGLRAPSIAEVESAERYAVGSVDYGATWIYRVVKVMYPLNRP